MPTLILYGNDDQMDPVGMMLINAGEGIDAKVIILGALVAMFI